MAGVAKVVRAGLVVLALLLASLAPARAATFFKQADFYSATGVIKVELMVPAPSLSSLAVDPKKFTDARVRFTSGSKDSGWINVGLRLKGTTSIEPITGRPSLKVKFNFKSKQQFLGLKGMTLNAMQQDGAKIHEFGTYLLARSMDVPAPRTGWANVVVNGVDKGLYVNVETIDDIFLARNFKDNTNHLYEGIALKDFKPGNADGKRTTGSFTVDEGWKLIPNKNELATLITALNVPDNAQWWKNFGTYMDRPRMINLMAIENFIGHWDSYSGPIINNYYVRSNAQGKFTMIPWGADQSFGENRATPDPLDLYSFSMVARQVGFPWVQQAFKTDKLPRGLIFMRCMSYKPCKVAYLKALKAVSAKVTSIKLVSKMKSAVTATKKFRTASTNKVTAKTYEFIAAQQTRVSKLMKANGIK